MSDVDAVVVGAGVVGLAIGRALALSGRSVMLLEGEGHFGSWTSARSSEVIHAGLYYQQGSLKARACVRGRRLLYEFCRARGVAHRNCGKLVVAAGQAQIAELEEIAAAAAANGVEDWALLDAADVRALEPDVRAVAAFHSPVTGIVDSHAYMLALLGEAEAHGARLVCNSRVARIVRTGQAWGVCLTEGGGPDVTGRLLINSAGLAAQALARQTEGMPPESIPRQGLAKGSYCTYAGRVPFTRLIYPVPEPGGLGVHLTLDTAGQARFGPDVEWIERIDYGVDPALPARMAPGIAAWWPGFEQGRLSPGYAGIRPKIVGKGEPAGDFMVAGPAAHGLPGMIALYGIESPGLTASLALAEHVLAMSEAA